MKIPNGRVPDSAPENGAKFAGAYHAQRVYGGPEEGGWWYNIYDHQASLIIPDGQDPLAAAQTLWEQFSHMDDGRSLGSVLSNGAVFILWENAPKEHHNTDRQYYE
jgi:hypothetical protein